MANKGWDGNLQSDRFDPKGRFGEFATTCETFDVTNLIVPTTVGEQNRRAGWTRVECPVDNESAVMEDRDLPKWKLPTGVPMPGYNVAAETAQRTGP